MSKHIIAPYIHPNGDSADTILDAYNDAIVHLTESVEMVQKCAPNGRNFYCHPYDEGDQALRIAQDQHADRLRKIREVMVELYALSEAVADRGQFAEIGGAD